jgi:plasmid stability protein
MTAPTYQTMHVKLPLAVHAALKRAAAEHTRSASGELVAILREQLAAYIAPDKPDERMAPLFPPR